MEPMSAKLSWRDILIGSVHHRAAHDMPWWFGVFEPTDTDCEVRALLQWFHGENKTDYPDLTLAPFGEHCLENWILKHSDGTRPDISPPSPDFDDMTIEWR